MSSYNINNTITKFVNNRSLVALDKTNEVLVNSIVGNKMSKDQQHENATVQFNHSLVLLLAHIRKEWHDI
jgi:hypothetical protein